jgi:hypothetical protein
MNQVLNKMNKYVIQRYYEDVALIEGRKFDIRSFMIILCTKPFVVLYNPGYFRLCLEKYTMENFGSKESKIGHLTNNSIQKKHKDFKELKEDSIWTFEKATNYFEGQGIDREEFTTKVNGRMKEIMRMIFETVKVKLDRTFGCFELFGFDFLLDNKLVPQFIEVNKNPALFTDTLAQKQVLTELVDRVIKLALEVHPFGAKDGEAQAKEIVERIKAKEPALANFDVVYFEQ